MSADQGSNRKPLLKWVGVPILIVVAVLGMAFVFLFHQAMNAPRRGPSDHVFDVCNVGEDLKPFIAITFTGSHGQSGASGREEYRKGYVQWIGQSNESVDHIENLHLINYAKVNGTRTYEGYDQVLRDIQLLFVVYTGTFTLPEDILGCSEEITIPYIGIDSTKYYFDLGVTFPPS